MILGIDPGLTGAIALIDGEDCLQVWDMPAIEKTHGKGKEVNAYLLADLIVEAVSEAEGNIVAHVEQVSAMPGQGVSSMFSFGHSAGVVKGVLGALGVKVVMVRPQAWKKTHSLTGKGKDASRTLAISLYPEMRHRLERKKDVGRADAMLIASS